METNDSYLPQDKIFTADKRQYGRLDLKGRARSMRHAPTPAEEVLWQRLRGNQLGVKFRRQHSIDQFIADFVCLPHKLIVELDGPGHREPDQAEYDQGRSQVLVALGYCILRFPNDEALYETEAVLQTIKAAL
ncbi:endonuclease domain-containing protein [Hymenobacter cellulosilyticus]|uniref:Endonuclease domain-containing protein n=1 Tax=Hymenobacter cellulosilyticus TaxID=2932248 RepID=A0A8T9Q6M7_9BACT|nr:endonuclease domain-containing protein [Hymenobacter cellulosilyticus]UOQ71420.1 endonuclease domain-containing protein [Hymenobacter cellulosilyticus]